jgi:hypothetical protein
MQNGSKTVQIGGQEVMLKDQSFYQTSPLGDEAATNSFGGSVVTHKITGKTYFEAWSMDVQFEGQNVDRNLDLTTSNHASPPPGPPQTDVDKILVPVSDKKEKCPVCDKSDPGNPTPGQKPPYLDPPRVPKDNETLIGREGLKQGKPAKVKGAKIYQRGNTLVHRDTLHAGKGAELETYNSRGTEHRGAICAHCGAHKGKVDKKKKCDP